MKNIYYRILALPVYLLMLLPLPVLYVLSDFFYLILYKVMRYRTKVVLTNLRNAFPDKSHEELLEISRKYYHFLVDLFIETFKLLTMSPAEVQKRVVFDDLTLAKQMQERKQSFLYVMGHYGNWEWCGQSFMLKNLVQLDVLYHPLRNQFFDWLTFRLRTRWGVGPIPMNVSIKEMIRRRSIVTATAFIADQTPPPENAYWTPFLNQDTPVFIGTEKIAKKFNYPVIFVSVRREKRGYYRTYFSLITDNPKDTPEGWITEAHTRMLEEDIRRQPEIWLWSHRRWKHKRVRNVE